VHYDEKEQATCLQQALSEMQIMAQVTKLVSTRSSFAPKKQLFTDVDPELTLKLLKITPQQNELQV